MSGGWKMLRVWEKRWGDKATSGKIIIDVIIIGQSLIMSAAIEEYSGSMMIRGELQKKTFNIKGIYVTKDLLYDYVMELLADYHIKPESSIELTWRKNEWE